MVAAQLKLLADEGSSCVATTHCNPLENKHTPLIRAPTLANHSIGSPIRSRQRPPYIAQSGALEDTIPLLASHVALCLLVRRVSHPAVPSSSLHLRVGYC